MEEERAVTMEVADEMKSTTDAIAEAWSAVRTFEMQSEKVSVDTRLMRIAKTWITICTV